MGGRFAWLGVDMAADLTANLREYREESLGGAEDAQAEVVAFPVEHLRKEVEALKWLRQEVAARSEEAEELRRQNEELRLQRAEFRERYPELFVAEEERRGPDARGSAKAADDSDRRGR